MSAITKLSIEQYRTILRNDFGSFIERSLCELNPAEPNPYPTPLRVLAFVVLRSRQRHLLCAVICIKSQVKNNLNH